MTLTERTPGERRAWLSGQRAAIAEIRGRIDAHLAVLATVEEAHGDHPGPAPDATGLDLAPILARADAATEGPWRLQIAACDHPDADNHSAIKGGGALVVACAEDADATFIAHARTDIPTLVAEVTRLRTALAHAITTGCAAVAEALREGEEARADLATARSRLAHIVAALRVAPSRDVPGDPTAALLVSHIEADRRDLARAGDEMLRLTRERDEARARVKALESAPTFADGVRAGLEAAAAWVDGDDTFDPLIPLTQHMNVAGLSHDERAQIEGILDAVLAGAAEAIRGIDPSTVKP